MPILVTKLQVNNIVTSFPPENFGGSRYVYIHAQYIQRQVYMKKTSFFFESQAKNEKMLCRRRRRIKMLEHFVLQCQIFRPNIQS